MYVMGKRARTGHLWLSRTLPGAGRSVVAVVGSRAGSGLCYRVCYRAIEAIESVIETAEGAQALSPL